MMSQGKAFSKATDRAPFRATDASLVELPENGLCIRCNQIMTYECDVVLGRWVRVDD